MSTSRPRGKGKAAERATIGELVEPNWARILTDGCERAAASEHWRRIAGEMHQLQILAPSNGHALQRLVLAYLIYDRCSLAVAVDGLVTEKNPDNPKSIARLSIHYQAMREAEKTTERLEAQLGLTPGGAAAWERWPRSGSAGPVRTRSSGRKSSAQDPVTDWARAAVRGDFVVGELVRHAAERHLRDLRDLREYFWRPELAQRVIDFFPAVFTITDGPAAGQPFELIPYQLFVAGSLMGWVTAEARWRFRSAWIETGKGQAKSPLMGGLGLYALGWCGFERAQIYSIAGDKRTANILFRDAAAMCRAQIPGYDEGESLESRGDVVIRGELENAHRIEHPKSKSFFEPLAFGFNQSGPRPRLVLADEVHEFSTDSQIEIWQRAIAKVAGSAMIVLGTNTPATAQLVGTSYSDRYQAIARGDIREDTAFAFVARVDKADRPTVFENEGCWVKALPALGITFPLANIREEVQKANNSLSAASFIKRLYFGIPIGAPDFWISEEAWAAVLAPIDDDKVAKLRGCKCWLSLDLSKKNDLTALTAVWRDADGHLWAKTWYWTVQDGLAERAKADLAKYVEWVEDGYLTAVPGVKLDFTFIASKVQAIEAEHDVEELAVDSALMADFEAACDEVGFPIWRWEGADKPKGEGLKWVFHAQGKRVYLDKPQHCMPLSIARLEDRILGQTITIDSSPVTYMCAANAAVDVDGMGNRCFDKKRSRGRIDGLVTTAMATGAADSVAASDGSVYETRGVRIL